MAHLWARRLHQAACFAATAAVCWVVFGDLAKGWVQPYCLLLPLAWVALALDLRSTVAVLAIILFAAVFGDNPYGLPVTDPLKRHLVLDLALAIAAGFGLTLAAIMGALRRDHAALVLLNVELEERIKVAVALSEKSLTRAKRAKRLRALGQVAGGVAHEFNNILQAATGGLEVIMSRPTDTERVLRMAGAAMSAVERGSVITRRLLTFARRAPLNAASVDVVATLTALREPLVRMVGDGIAVIMAFQDALPAVLVDKTELETALINLAANARDAMPAGGTLTISATVVTINGIAHPRATLGPGRYICVVVRDSGTGMDAAVLARAEEPFFTTKPIGFGTGLGLSMAKGFAEQSGGGLVIESTPERGTIVTVWLPTADG
jgi:signal transduction histidine kinase